MPHDTDNFCGHNAVLRHFSITASFAVECILSFFLLTL